RTDPRSGPWGRQAQSDRVRLGPAAGRRFGVPLSSRARTWGADGRWRECLPRGGRADPDPQDEPQARRRKGANVATVSRGAGSEGGEEASGPPRGRRTEGGEHHAGPRRGGEDKGNARRDQRRAPDRLRNVPPQAGSMIGPAHHIGVAVRRLDEALADYGKLGFEAGPVEEMPTQGVRVAFLRAGPVRIELPESLSPEGAIARFIERRGEGLD